MIEADITRPPGSRVIAVKVGEAALDPAKTYPLATNDSWRAAATTT
jgi:hypothetical protein